MLLFYYPSRDLGPLHNTGLVRQILPYSNNVKVHKAPSSKHAVSVESIRSQVAINASVAETEVKINGNQLLLAGEGAVQPPGARYHGRG